MMTNQEEPFETLLERLRDIVEGLERGGLSLEESLAQFEEGVKLSRAAARRLDAAEKRIEALLTEDGTIKAVPISNTDSET